MAARARPSIDVLVPCYNYGRFLTAAVDSVMQPGGPPVRVLIIDDCSPDDTPAVAAAIASRYPNVTVRRHQRNAGHHNTYNEGLEWARSPYFVLLSADDLIAPGALARAVDVFEAHPEVGLVYGRTPMFSGAPPVSPAGSAPPARIVDGHAFIEAASRHGRNPIDNPAGVMVRTELQHRVGGYHPELPHSGDLEMWLRFAACASVATLDVDQGFYRRHNGNMSHEYPRLDDCRQCVRAWELFAERFGSRIANAELLVSRVRHVWAKDLFAEAVRAFDARIDADITGYVRCAARLDPGMVRSAEWRRFAVKRLLGSRLATIGSRLRGAIRAPRGNCGRDVGAT